MNMRSLIINKDYEGIKKALAENPALANEGIPLDEKCLMKAHPLHRLCDGVINGICTDAEAVEMAKIFLAYGADVNGNEMTPTKDTPLVAASSLHADAVALLLIDRGATIHHPGCSGGTALHWAAWTGRDILVHRLIREGADINKRCMEFKGTPLLWAVHGYKFGGGKNRHHQVECVRMLIAAGADKTIPNGEGTPPLGMLEDGDKEMIEVLS